VSPDAADPRFLAKNGHREKKTFEPRAHSAQIAILYIETL